MSSFKEKANTYLAPVVGRYHELEIVKGEGSYLIDTAGKRYLDFGAGIAVAATGHCHPAVTHAIASQAATLIHPCIAIGNYAPLIDCAESLCALLPTASAADRYTVFFEQSGTGAVEAALKLAKSVRKKHRILAFEGGFHGRSMGSLSVTSSKRSYRDHLGPMLAGVSFFPYPYCYRCPWGHASAASCTLDCVTELGKLPLISDDLAAIIIEPILGEGGYVPAPIPFLKALSSVCAEHGVLLICDEIQSGMGRTGPWFNYEKAGIFPDIIVTAKGLGSGMPIGACLAKKHIMDQWQKGAHGGTYGGNPIACAAATATIEVIKKVKETIPQKSAICAETLHAALATHPFIGDIRINGLMIGIECVTDKALKTPNPHFVQSVLQAACKEGLILISCGSDGHVIRLAPPLTITLAELETGLTCLLKVLHDCC